MMVASVLAGCAAPAEEAVQETVSETVEQSAEESTEETNNEPVEAGVVNLYTDRHYDTDAELYAKFTEKKQVLKLM